MSRLAEVMFREPDSRSVVRMAHHLHESSLS